MHGAAALLVLAIALPAHAGRHATHSWLTWGDLGRLAPEVAAVLAEPAAAPIAATAGYVDQLLRLDIQLAGDRSVSTNRVLVREFQSDEGIREFGNFVLGVSAQLETLEVVSAFVRQPDGTVSVVDPATIQIVTRSQPTGVFSDAWEVVVPLPELHRGSKAVIATHSRFDRAHWPFGWSRVVSIGDVAPLRRFEAAVRWTKDVPTPRSFTNDPAMRCSEAPGQIECVRLDIAEIELDPDVESYLDVIPQLVFTQERSWKGVSQRVRELMASATEASAELRARAIAIVGEQSDARDKAARLFRFVADQVRYVGLEHGPQGVVPSPASVTLARRYGDCKGKVALLLALARAVGITGHPVLLASDFHSPSRLLAPSSAYFDHMIACFDLGEPSLECVDPTAAELPFGELPEAIFDAVALMPGEAAPVLAQVATPVFGREIRVRARNRVSCEGRLVERLDREFRGPWAFAIRSSLKQLSEEQRRSELVAGYRDVLGEKVDPVARLRQLDEPSEPLVIETETDFGDVWDRKTEVYREDDAWLDGYLSRLITRNRVQPYRFPGLDYDAQFTYELCDAWKTTFHGPSLDMQGPLGSLQRRSQLAGNHVTVQTRVRIPRRLLGSDEAARMNAFLEELAANSRMWFRVEQGAR